jgi:hypothetical protein
MRKAVMMTAQDVSLPEPRLSVPRVINIIITIIITITTTVRTKKELKGQRLSRTSRLVHLILLLPLTRLSPRVITTTTITTTEREHPSPPRRKHQS